MHRGILRLCKVTPSPTSLSSLIFFLLIFAPFFLVLSFINKLLLSLYHMLDAILDSRETMLSDKRHLTNKLSGACTPGSETDINKQQLNIFAIVTSAVKESGRAVGQVPFLHHTHHLCPCLSFVSPTTLQLHKGKEHVCSVPCGLPSTWHGAWHSKCSINTWGMNGDRCLGRLMERSLRQRRT